MCANSITDNQLSWGKQYMIGIIMAMVIWYVVSLIVLGLLTLMWWCLKRKRGSHFQPKAVCLLEY
jgi:heme/copper-type cytochrome/quinol oxidase subunit 2